MSQKHYESYTHKILDIDSLDSSKSLSKHKKCKEQLIDNEDSMGEAIKHSKLERYRMYRLEFETDDVTAVTNPYSFINENVHLPSTATYTCAIVQTKGSGLQGFKIVATQYFSERKHISSQFLHLPICKHFRPILKKRHSALDMPTHVADDCIGPFIFGLKPTIRKDTIPIDIISKSHKAKFTTDKIDFPKKEKEVKPASGSGSKESKSDIISEITKSRDLIIESMNGLKRAFPDMSLHRKSKARLPMFLPNVWGMVLPNITGQSSKCNYWIYSETKDLQTEFGDLMVSSFNIEYYDGSIIDQNAEGVIIKDKCLNATDLSILCNRMVHKYSTSFYMLIVVLSSTPLFQSIDLSSKFNEINLDCTLGKKSKEIKETSNYVIHGNVSMKQQVKMGKLKVFL